MTDETTLEVVLNSHTKDHLPVLYISGPMSGIPDHNFPAFNEFARKMRLLGFPVLNPADFGDRPEFSWADCLARDLPLVTHCEIVVLLDGWERSRGAQLERTVGLDLGKVVMEVRELIDRVVHHYYTREQADRLRLLDQFRQSVVLGEGPDGLGIVVPWWEGSQILEYDPETGTCRS